jgi:hypothetical protein
MWRKVSASDCRLASPIPHDRSFTMQHTALTTPKGALTSIATLCVTLLTLAGCSKRDGSPPAQDSAASTSASAKPSASDSTPASPSDITPVRGKLAVMSDSALTISTATGDVHVIVAGPLHVFARVPAKLSSVKPSSFVGVTSVAQPDGSQRATEIHLFPEELRGTGEGSYLMTPQPGSDSSHRSTMTNGTVSANPKAGDAPRMTNGTIASQGTGTLTVQYRGGSQTIAIPTGVSVTEIAPVNTKLSSGAKVVVLATKQADGTMKASSVLVTDSAARAK